MSWVFLWFSWFTRGVRCNEGERKAEPEPFQMEVLEEEKAQRRKQNKEEEGGGWRTCSQCGCGSCFLEIRSGSFQFLSSPTGEMMLCRHFEQVSNQDNLFFWGCQDKDMRSGWRWSGCWQVFLKWASMWCGSGEWWVVIFLWPPGMEERPGG